MSLTKKKILFSSFIVLLVFLNSFYNACANEENLISEMEKKLILEGMTNRGIISKTNIEVLFDAHNEPAFLIGYGNEGYLIVYRSTMCCVEAGTINPYKEFICKKKFYTGILDYYIYDDADGFFSLNSLECYKEISNNDGFFDSLQKVNNYPYVTSSITTSVFLPNRYDYIQRVAFGCNNDNTCTAVACTIVLNYLDKSNNNIVPSSFQLPYCNNGNTNTINNVTAHYSSAHNFHRYLVDNCGMGAATYASGVTTGIANYRNQSVAVNSTNISASWAMPYSVSSVKQMINSSKPSMLTTTFAGDYSWHTMVIYGYRTYNDGSTEYLVHTGWYTSMVKISGSTSAYYMPYIWVSSSIATYGYSFTYN